MSDSPVRAVRSKPKSSMCIAYKLVRDKKASAVISTGNSGAFMAAGRLIAGLLPGVERPAITVSIPRPKNGKRTIILDAASQSVEVPGFPTPANTTMTRARINQPKRQFYVTH